MPISGQIWSLKGKKSQFLLEKAKVWYPHNGKTLFALFFGRTLDEMCQICQYLDQDDQKCQFWAKNRYSFRGSKSFGTNVTEKTPTHLVRIVFWSGVGPNEPKMPIFGQKSQFWAKLAVYGPKSKGKYKPIQGLVSCCPPVCTLLPRGYVQFYLRSGLW